MKIAQPVQSCLDVASPGGVAQSSLVLNWWPSESMPCVNLVDINRVLRARPLAAIQGKKLSTRGTT